ncbi:MAG: LacI family transcriptional regulator [Candidatus Saganbacteria bacterium]|uniref:LacI family transcriptional regulator n=1 Tax=Candidatus Saganbacteria bacterium TaxID=2575572 RepID=A0A833L0K1_UNCSA|nr:MAG: LacI family transcriptional regulator [Candidatus Saganbacteria bacterium]
MKKTTIYDIAKRAKLSPATVSQVFNNPARVSPENRRAVLDAAEWLSYVRPRKRRGTQGAVGIVADNFYNCFLGEFYNLVAHSIAEELKALNKNIYLEAFSKEDEVTPQIIAKNLVDGILFLGKIDPAHIIMTKQKHVPFVLIGHPIPNIEYACVIPDNRSGSVQVVEHLLGLGHKKIAVVLGEPNFDPTSFERLEGYRYALGSSQIDPPKEYIRHADFGKPKTAYNATYDLLQLNDPPTAIFYTSDSLAYRGYQAIKDLGLKIPENISVVGFDNIDLKDYLAPFGPPLTTVNVDQRKMGKIAVELLCQIINNPQRIPLRYTLPVKLFVKESTAKPKVF